MGSKVAPRSLRRARALEFADKNLKLALLDEVHSSFTWLQEEEARYESARGSHPTWPTWKAIRDNEDAHHAALEEYLLGLEIPADKLRAIQSLTLDGDRNLYSWIYSFWWEDGDHFTIRDLSGIEHCRGLESLRLGQGLVEGCSLRPLTGLPELRELHLCALGQHQDLEALLDIPKLQKLDIVNLASSPDKESWEPVIEALMERGLPSLSRR